MTTTILPTRSGLVWWQAIPLGAALAAALNLIVLGIATAAGAELVIRQEGSPDHEIVAGGVLFSSVVPLVIGTGLAVLLALAWRGFLRLAQVLGGGFGILSAFGPLLSAPDTGTKVGLALMHVVVGLAVILTMELIIRKKS
ncbi:hypothetical protein Val02_19220 [Virgisporangium aliadipatigenens]|uniref:Uncharacterized protein n=1 Tax=Virgisporangium aliadipatigenens TaxID=741659 RepID=A0A8J3YJF2_9ACTN|nr:DUF6069 family protein [Virgisporangium aliadipatigenens]GIJ45036.1 hypothetical protein Val02_19220 [Virgisporangium aliadipatigenens]